MSQTQTFHATGLTCGHCGHAVTEEVSAIDGVATAEVAVVNGGESTITVQAEREIGLDEVSAALAEAGDYQLVP